MLFQMSRTYSTHKTGIIPDKGLITITVLPLQYVGTITVLTLWYLYQLSFIQHYDRID